MLSTILEIIQQPYSKWIRKWIIIEKEFFELSVLEGNI